MKHEVRTPVGEDDAERSSAKPARADDRAVATAAIGHPSTAASFAAAERKPASEPNEAPKPPVKQVPILHETITLDGWRERIRRLGAGWCG